MRRLMDEMPRLQTGPEKFGRPALYGGLAKRSHGGIVNHLETRRVRLAGFTPYPDQGWMEQQARNMTMRGVGMPERLPLSAA